MEAMFKPPEQLVVNDANLAEQWKRFKQRFELYAVAIDLKSKSQEQQVAIFLTIIGEDGLELYNSFTLTSAEQKSLDAIKGKFDEYCSPKKNIIFERFKFNSVIQKEGQTFDNFLTELRRSVKSTEYINQDEMVRDRIVIGICDKGTQERLLRESSLTLEKAITFCRSIEASKVQAKVLKEEAAGVNAIRSHGKAKSKTESKTYSKGIDCKYCGYNHKKGRCPAYGKTCDECGAKHHFAAVCMKKDETKNKPRKKVHEVKERVKQEYETSEDSDEDNSGSDSTSGNSEFFVSSITKNVGSVEELWKSKVCVEGTVIEFKLDTGAEVSIIPVYLFRSLKTKKQLNATNVTLISYGSSEFRIKPIGKISLECSVNKEVVLIDFLVVDCKNQMALLGLSACVKLNLIQRIDNVSLSFNSINNLISKYSKVFSGLGQFPSKYKIILKENVVPHTQPSRRVPQAIYEKLKKKLDNLQALNIIQKVEKPTDWLNPLVIVEKKNGDLRLCLDPKFLNQAIKREPFLIPTADEIASKLSNKKYFTVLDMKDGYFQVMLDKQSSNLCAFATPFGRYKFCRMPFGISSAPEVFQKLNFELFGDIKGVEIYFDDLIITGSSEFEHDQNLKLVLDRAEKFNIKFNKDKIQLKANRVKFMGHIFSEKGIEPSSDYIKAIVKMPTPQNKQELLRLLGMAKYLNKFIPNLSKISAPLRNLTRNDVDWHWNNDHEQSLNQLKHLITNAPVLTFFNPSFPIEIETDASKDGIGTCLLQNGHPVAYASRSLSSTEVKYAQIEKELLAIVFSCQKFHYLIYGVHNVTVFSDHKPLESIFKKNLQQVPPRLQRMLLKIIHYNLRVIYKPGKYLHISDALSRAFLNEDNPKVNLDLEHVVHSVSRHLPISANIKKEFRKAYEGDTALQTIIGYVTSEWPSNKQTLPEFIRHYHKIKDFLFLSDSFLFFNYRLIVPQNLRHEMLTKLHEGHIGMEKVKRRAREIFYWPGINGDIEKYIKKCKICERFAQKNAKQTLLPYPLPDRPWQRVGADIFSYQSKSYLVLMDAFSNWLEILIIKNKSASEVIQKLKVIFSKFGSPEELTCDNIPFGSYSFEEFSKEWNFNIVTRSPNYPRSNGLAEKAVGIAKKLLKKSLEEGKDIFESLLQYRNSPLKYLNYSPSQLFLNRICKTKLPICADLLKPALCQNVKERLLQRQTINKNYFNKTATDLKPLKDDQNVVIYNHVDKYWEPGKIVQQHSSPRSYQVLNSSGDVLRRNRLDLKLSNNEFVPYKQDFEATNVATNSEDCVGTDNKNNGSDNVGVQPSSEPSVPQTKTKSGRVIKCPVRLDL